MKMFENGRPEHARKAATGIAGFDEITHGGWSRGRVTLIEGGPGSGKTVMSLQALVHGARHDDEPGIFVAFEETSERIASNAAKFGWDLGALDKKLSLLNAQVSPDLVQGGGFDLSGMLAILKARADEIGSRPSSGNWRPNAPRATRSPARPPSSRTPWPPDKPICANCAGRTRS